MHLTSSRSEDRVTGPRRLHYQMLGYALPEDSIPTATFAPSSRCRAFIGFDLHASTPVSDLTAVILRCLSFQQKHYQLKNPGCHHERLRGLVPRPPCCRPRQGVLIHYNKTKVRHGDTTRYQATSCFRSNETHSLEVCQTLSADSNQDTLFAFN
jgi:hypothetical protein